MSSWKDLAVPQEMLRNGSRPALSRAASRQILEEQRAKQRAKLQQQQHQPTATHELQQHTERVSQQLEQQIQL